MKKMFFVSALIWGLNCLAASPDPVVSLALDEGDLAAIKAVAPGGAELKINNPEFLKWVDGPNGKALYFHNADGNVKRGSIIVKMAAPVDLSKGFSVSMTVKTAAEFTTKRIYEIFGFADGFVRRPGVNLFFSWKMCWLRFGCNGSMDDIKSKISDRAIQGDTWYQIAAVYDGNVAQLYIDSQLVGENTMKIETPKNQRYLQLGSTGDGHGYGFDGVITDFKFFDRPLTPIEIAAMQKEN